MKIKLMDDNQLNDAIKYMGEVPIKDPQYSAFNFDTVEYIQKYCELLQELITREDDDYKLTFNLSMEL